MFIFGRKNQSSHQHSCEISIDASKKESAPRVLNYFPIILFTYHLFAFRNPIHCARQVRIHKVDWPRRIRRRLLGHRPQYQGKGGDQESAESFRGPD